MSIHDLPPGIEAVYDSAHRGWRCWIPLDVIESELHRKGFRLEKTKPHNFPPDGRPLAAEMARIIAKPGPVQREVRRRVQKNNRRRFGP